MIWYPHIVIAFLISIIISLTSRSSISLSNNLHRVLLVAISYYIIFSTIEVFIHKYLMHEWKSLGLAKSHIHHHLNVNNENMELRLPDDAHEDEFSWLQILLLSFITIVITWPYFRFLRVSFRIHVIIVTLITLIVMTLWNNIHNAMHDDEKNIPCTYGPPKFFKNETIHKFCLYSTWLDHHRLHHVIKSRKTNFGIICLGADRIFGTSPTKAELEEAENTFQSCFLRKIVQSSTSSKDKENSDKI